MTDATHSDWTLWPIARLQKVQWENAAVAAALEERDQRLAALEGRVLAFAVRLENAYRADLAAAARALLDEDDADEDDQPGDWRRAEGALKGIGPDEPAEVTIRRLRDSWDTGNEEHP